MAAQEIDTTENSLSNTRVPILQGQEITDRAYKIFRNIDSMRDYLLGEGYRREQLNPMSKNDLIFACRQKSGLDPLA